MGLQAQKLKTHVFACERWMVFSDIEMKLDTNAGGFVKVAYPKGIKRPNTKNYVNLPVFLNVWRAIKTDTNWKSFPWVVKADPSTVFIPQRLRELVRYQLVTEQGVYMENCKYVRMSFHGSLEVMSKDAFATFLDNLDDCYETLPWKDGVHAHFKYYGEDKFLQFCMDKHGVTRVPSRQIVDTVPKDQNIYGLHLTVSCPGHRTKFETTMHKWHPNCSRSVTAAIHAFKTPKSWLECLKNTTEIKSSQLTWPALT